MAETENGPAAGGFPLSGKRGRVLAALAAAVVLVVAYNLYWAYAAGQVRTGIEQWAAERRAQGQRITYSALRVNGYPFHLEAVIAGPAIADFTTARPWSWRGPALTLTARPWRPSRLRLKAPGRHWLTVVALGDVTEATVEAKDLTLKLKTRRGAIVRAALSLRGVRLMDSVGRLRAGLAAADVIAERPTAGSRTRGPPLAILVDAEGIELPGEPGPGLGRETARFGFQARVTEGLMRSLEGGAALGDALTAWRDDGGTVEVSGLVLRHGPLAIDGDGTLALDGGLQPIGAFSTTIGGFEKIVDALRVLGAVDPHTAALAKAALRSLAAEKTDASQPAIKVPVSLQDRRLYLGPVPLLRWRPITWE